MRGRTAAGGEATGRGQRRILRRLGEGSPPTTMTAKADADPPLSRRRLLRLIGKAAGGSAMYHAMTALGFAAPSTYAGPLDLQGASKGSTVLILGAGMAGLVAAYELRRAGYGVQVLEYNERAGGRSHCLGVERAEGPADQSGLERRSHCGFEQDVDVAPADRAGPRMEALGDEAAPLHGDVGGQIAVGTAHPGDRVALDRRVEVDDLVQAVDAGVGAAGADRPERRARERRREDAQAR